MRKVFLSVVAAVGLFWGVSRAEAAVTQVDSLLDALVEKGYFTEAEAREIKGDIVADEKVLREDGFKQSLPSWVTEMKLKGDFRLRYEYSNRNDSTDIARSRGRIRYRLGIETKPNDKVKVGFGIASDGGNPRSTNRTFTDDFTKSNIILDYAYAEYVPNDLWILQGGKMPKMPFWQVSDLLWDTDITPEGGAITANVKLSDAAKVFATVAPMVLDESSTDVSDPYMLVAQGGIELKAGEKADAKVAGTWYYMTNLGKELLDNRSSPTTNTVVGGRYAYHYDSIGADFEAGINNPLEDVLPIAIPRVALIGQFIHNPDPADNNNGWLAGAYFGDKKVNGPGQWKVTGAYRYLQTDAWLDAWPDSDFYGGATDVKGFEGILEVGLAKNVTWGLDFYSSRRIVAAKAQEVVVQSDINFRF